MMMRRGIEKGVVVGQIEHLPVGHFGQLFAAIANIHAPQAGKRVQNFVALAIPNLDAIGMGDDPRATGGMEGLVVCKGMKMMVDVVLDDFSDIDVFLMYGHGFSPKLS